MGLRGAHGLFASAEWWKNVESGTIPIRRVSGVIVDAYVAGQDASPFNNTVDLKCGDGVVRTVGLYANNPSDARLFRIGRVAEVVYVLDELKAQPSPTGDTDYLEIAVEMAVAVEAE
jgi:hypothetical protein